MNQPQRIYYRPSQQFQQADPRLRHVNGSYRQPPGPGPGPGVAPAVFIYQSVSMQGNIKDKILKEKDKKWTNPSN